MIQVILPRAILFFLSVGIAVFCYYESMYHADHAASLGAKSASDVRIWMWVFRSISAITIVFAIVLITDLTRKLF